MLNCFRKNVKVKPVEFIEEEINDKIFERIKNDKKIIFGPYYNSPIANLPNAVESISFYGGSFNYPIDNLPNNLKSLTLNSRFNQPVDFLPQGLEVLKFLCGSIFSHRLDNLPNTLKILEIPLKYNQDINCIPDSIQELRIGVKTMANDENLFYPEVSSICSEDDMINFDKHIKKIPGRLKKLFIFPKYEFIDELKEKLGDKVVVISKETYLYYNMTFTNSLYIQPRSNLLKDYVQTIELLVHGQGVFLFKNDDNKNQCVFYFQNKHQTSGIKIEFTKFNVIVTKQQCNEPLIDDKNKQGLSNKKGAYYWVSLDSQNQRIYAGVGEPRMETKIYNYQFPKNEKLWESNKKFLESIDIIQIPQEAISLKPLKLLRDPITSNIPLLVKNTDDLTMDDVARGNFLPKSNLAPIAQKLYDCIAGKKFVLDDDDFPNFSQAIEYSIVTPNCWCNKTLIKKSREFDKEPNLKETYLRITLGENNGESPGIPYVMEIWPIGHFSPIHNHGGAHAIIRVLHGSINVSLFPFLSPDRNEVLPFGKKDFNKDDITWISPAFNQVHQLKNHDSSTQTCITIQCYMYDEEDRQHYDYFDYLDGKDNKKQYEPDSDMDFIQFKMLMKEEWENRPWMPLLSQSCFSRKH